MNDANKGITFQQHKQWLDHPITRQLFTVLGNHESAVLKSIVANAGISEKPEQQDRNAVILSVQLKTTQTITKIAADTEVFIAKLYGNNK